MNIDIYPAFKKAFFISVTNDSGLEVVFCSLGASVYSLKLDIEPMILSYRDFPVFYDSPSYQGKTLGRIAGRIKDGKLDVDGVTYQLDQNEGNNTLHGGKESLSFKVWSHQVERLKNGIIVKFYYTSKKGECGFNGKVDFVVSYKIPKDDNNIIVEYDAYPRKEDTLINLTNHMYFNLANKKDILSHHLQIKASEVSILDEELIVTGYKNVTDTIFDFRKPKLISKDIKSKELQAKKLNGYDHHFKLDLVEATEYNISLKCEMYTLNIYTDYDEVVIYTDGYAKEDILLDDSKETVFKGIAIEPCLSKPELVKRKTHYQHKIKYVFVRNLS